MKRQNHAQTRPSSDAVATRAYHLWETAGCPSGRDKEHWLQAEAELTAASQNGMLKAVSPGAGPMPGPGNKGACL